MRIAPASKLLPLALLAAVTVIATSSVVSSVRRSHAAQDPPPPPPPQPTIQIADAPVANAAVAAVRFQDNPIAIAGGGTGPCEMEPVDGVVHIKAKMYVYDKRPNINYVWMVRVLDFQGSDWKLRVLDFQDRKKVLFSKIYDDQIVILPEEREASPTFEDVIEIPIPRGKYVLEIGLFMVTPECGVAGLKDPKLASSLSGPCASMKTWIGN